MARAGASYPSIFLGLDASRVQAGLESVKRMWSATMSTLTAPAKTALIGTAFANQAAEFGGKLTRLFGEPFRQLMEQEDLTSRFSLVAGGADKSSQAFEGFRRVSRETGVAIADMAQGLETLLQGQFSFEGARQQILDLTSVAAVLGQGSLPMLAQAAAKFRSQAFAGFEDINQVAAQGIPIYDALAQRLGVTADEARRMAREGLVTGLQARGALNDAAGQAVVRVDVKPLQDAREQLNRLVQNPVNVQVDGRGVAEVGLVLNGLAARGFPVFQALADQMGIAAQQAKELAGQGLIPAAEAARVIGKLEVKAGNGNALQAQEQTLSGVVSRLREGLSQTLATIGEAVSRAVDVPTVLARFRGFVEGIRSVIEAGLGPLRGVIGADGGGLKEKFQSAQEFTINALKAVSDGFFSFLRGMEGIVNQFKRVIDYLASWLPEKFSEAQEKTIQDFQKANQVRIQREVVGRGGELIKQRAELVDMPRDLAIKALREQGALPALPGQGGPIDLGINGMQANVNKALENARKNLADQNGEAAKQAEKLAAEQRRQAEATNEARDALSQFTSQFTKAINTPVELAQQKAQQLDTLIAQARNKGVEFTAQMQADNEAARIAIGRGMLDMLNQQAQIVNQSKESVAYNPGSTDLIASITRAQNRETVDPSVNIQQRVANLAQQQLTEQQRQNEISKSIYTALVALNQKPPVVQNIAAMR